MVHLITNNIFDSVEYSVSQLTDEKPWPQKCQVIYPKYSGSTWHEPKSILHQKSAQSIW